VNEQPHQTTSLPYIAKIQIKSEKTSPTDIFFDIPIPPAHANLTPIFPNIIMAMTENDRRTTTHKLFRYFQEPSPSPIAVETNDKDRQIQAGH